MEVIGILGDRGAFKTCKLVSALYEDWQNGEKITANFHLKFPFQYRTFEQVREELDRMEREPDYVPTFAGNKVAFDELSTGADSYEFMLTGNKKITKFVSQLRKIDCMMYYTDQRFDKVVKRIRDQTDAFFLMRDLDKGKMRHPNGKPAHRHRDVCDGLAEYLIVDSWLEPIGKGKARKFDGKPWYQYYNTDEFIHDRTG